MSKDFSIRDDLFLLKHPFYQAWVDGNLSLAALQDYSRQYYHHVEAFPRYLKNALNRCGDGPVKTVLSENLAEEDGTTFGTSHPELWLKFAEGVGVSRSEVHQATARKGIRTVVDTFTSYSEKSLSQALGSLYAYESQVPEIAHSKIEGLRNHFGIQDPQTLSFFEVHKIADAQHRNSLKEIIEHLSQDELKLAREAADVSCHVLWDFLSEIYQHNGYSHA
jgi:pyrroloquinoline-quinone synthase